MCCHHLCVGVYVIRWWDHVEECRLQPQNAFVMWCMRAHTASVCGHSMVFCRTSINSIKLHLEYQMIRSEASRYLRTAHIIHIGWEDTQHVYRIFSIRVIMRYPMRMWKLSNTMSEIITYFVPFILSLITQIIDWFWITIILRLLATAKLVKWTNQVTVNSNVLCVCATRGLRRHQKYENKRRTVGLARHRMARTSAFRQKCTDGINYY